MTREELKTATTEKLISALEYCGRDSYYATYYDEVVDEITKRLKQNEELQEENDRLKNDYEMIHNCFLISENEKKNLEKQIEKMKKCLRGVVYMADSGLYTKNELAFTRLIAEAKDLL